MRDVPFRTDPDLEDDEALVVACKSRPDHASAIAAAIEQGLRLR